MSENWAELIEKRNEAILNERKKMQQEMHMEADIQVAFDVARMAELGWFAVEFTMYGCAYLNPVDEKIYYKVSSNAEDIYNFIEVAMQKNIYASNIMQLTKKMAVPSGMRELIALDVKIELARILQETYPKEFFGELYRYADLCTDDLAAKLLWTETEMLEGLFDEEKLHWFEALVQYAYSCRKINDNTCQKLYEWIKEEYKNMDDISAKKDIQEKTLYGFAYEEKDTVYYIENAQQAYIYEKLYELEQRGYFVTPVYAKTYWYNYEYRLSDVKKDFKNDLRIAFNHSFLNNLKNIRKRNNVIPVDQYRIFLEKVKSAWGENAAATATRYGYRWGIL